MSQCHSFLCIWLRADPQKKKKKRSAPLRREKKTNKQTVFSCGLSRFNLCMPFVYSDRSCQTLTYTCTESYGCHCCWPWDWLKQIHCSEQVRPLKCFVFFKGALCKENCNVDNVYEVITQKYIRKKRLQEHCLKRQGPPDVNKVKLCVAL